MWQAIVAFIVVFAIGMTIRWFVTRNKKGAVPPSNQANAAPTPPAAGNACPKCGAGNDASASFCVRCGARLK
jgi:hypothetical protein